MKKITGLKFENIIYITFALILIFVAAYFVFFYEKEGVGSGNYDAFALSSSDLEVVSCSLDGKSGISEGDPLEIVFNQPIPQQASEIVNISPEVKGTWSVLDHRLIFEPAIRWNAGTLYSVSLQGETNIRYLNRSLKENMVFSFETQDSALRIPASATFRMDQQQYFVDPSEPILLDAGYTDVNGNQEVDATVKVWQFDNDREFIYKFSEIFTIPQWASITRNKTLVDTGGLSYLGKKDVTLKDGQISYPGLKEGKYLLRVVVGGAAIDVALTVDAMDVYSSFDGKDIDLWVHEKGQVLSGGKIRIDTAVEYLDDTGCGKISYGYSKAERASNPKLSVLEIVSEKSTQILFLEDRAFDAPAYDGLILGGKGVFARGETIDFYGNIIPKGTTALMPKEGKVVLQSTSGTIEEKTIHLEEEYSFSGSFKDISLPKGQYHLILKVNNNTIAETAFSIDSEVGTFGRLLVTQSDDTIALGESISFQVQALGKSGIPLRGIAVASSEGTSAVTDANGIAQFDITPKISSLEAYTKAIDFKAKPGILGTIEATAQYSVVNKNSDHYAIENGTLVVKGEEESILEESPKAKGDSRYFISDGNSFSIVTEPSPNASFGVTYQDGSYSLDKTQGNQDLSLTIPQSLKAESGEELVFSANAVGGQNTYYVAQLYQGQIPAALLGKTVKNEAYESTMQSAPVVSVGTKSAAITLSTQGLKGNCFVRIYALSQNGQSISGYIPVSISHGGYIFPEIAQYYQEGKEITIPFRCYGEDLSYQVTVDNQSVLTGTAEEENIANIGTYGLGNHQGAITLWNGDTLIDKEPFAFTVYAQEPDFMVATEEQKGDAILSYAVEKETQEYAEKLFELNLFPGNQLIEVLGRSLFFGALKDNAGLLKSYYQEDFSAYQNSDGSFSRIVGGTGDVLLSCFIAANENALYDQEALKTFFERKKSSTSDVEVLALSYWGLSLLGEAPLEEMTYHIEDKSFTDNGRLYLAEAFYANGDKATANKILKSVAKSLKKSEETYHYKDPEKNQSIFTALLTLDLSQKLNSQYTEGLITYLMGAKLETQSNRYLMTVNLVNYIKMDAIALVSNQEEATLNIVKDQPLDSDEVKGSFSINGEKIEKASLNSMVEFSLDWSSSAKKNVLYMIYFTPKQDILLVEDENTTFDHGHVMKLTMDTSTSLYFSPTEINKGVVGDVYILNVTSGQILAKVAVEDLVVVE